MNVLQVIPSLAEKSGGPSMAIIPLCRALQEKGIDVSLVSTNEGFTANGTDGFHDYQGVKTRVFPVNWGTSFKYSKELRAWLESNVNKYDVVHIHAVFNHACVAAARACQVSRVPYVLRPLGSLDSWSMKQKKLKKQLFWQIAAKKMVQNAAAVHYTSAAEQHDSENYLDLKRGTVIPLGVEVPEHAESQSDENNPYMLVISRLVPTKNIHLLLESFIKLSHENQFADWRLIIAGDGDEEYVRQLKARAAEVKTKVSFAGWVTGAEKFSLLRSASLFVLPSQHENFGVSVVEAMACKVPVVVSPEVAVAGEIQAREAGWTSPADSESLTNVLHAAMSNKSERLRRGAAAFELAKEFSWSRVAEKLVTLYEQIATRRIFQTA